MLFGAASTNAPVGRLVRTAALHLAVTLLFGAMAVWFTWPLAAHLGSRIPGEGAGDNVCFLWNTWWFRRTFIRQPSHILWSDAIFAPYGTPLVLNTHALLQSAASTLLPRATVITAHNAVLLVGLVANGICAYALGFSYSRQSLPSIAAGAIFAWCTYVSVHLLGHFNLVHAWVLPLFALSLVSFLDRPSHNRALAVACALAAATYSDYYHAVYCMVFAALAVLSSRVSVHGQRRERPLHRAILICLALACAIGVGIAAIALSGGTVIHVGPLTLSIRSARNLVALLGLVLAAAALMRYSVRFSKKELREATQPSRRQWATLILSFATLVAPLLRFNPRCSSW